MRKFIVENKKRFLTQKRRDAEAQKFSYRFFSASLRLCVFTFILVFPVFAQKLAFIIPQKTALTEAFTEDLEKTFSGKFKILDSSLSEAAFNSVETENVFNLTTAAAKNIGAVVGCDYFLLVRAANQRRVSLSKNDYYESFVVIYAVSSRTGRLVFWKLQSFESEKQTDAEKLLIASTNRLSNEISEKLKQINKEELNEKSAPKIEEVPDENSAAAKNLRPPLPFRRIKPEYTRPAYLYDIAATVDIEMDLDEDGVILRTEIVRWAGFGLDESVTEAVRKMNWRPAERNGKTLPMRILLRYNFKKV